MVILGFAGLEVNGGKTVSSTRLCVWSAASLGLMAAESANSGQPTSSQLGGGFVASFPYANHQRINLRLTQATAGLFQLLQICDRSDAYAMPRILVDRDLLNF